MNRTERLKQIIETDFEGSQAKFARAIKKAPAQVNQWFNGYRNIGNGTARDIEVALGKEIGWLDGAENVIKNVGNTVGGDLNNVQGDSYNLYQDTGKEPTKAELAEAEAKYLKSMPLMDINLAARYLINPDKEREQIYDNSERAATFIPHSSDTIGIRIADNSLIEFSQDKIMQGDILIIEPKIPPRDGDLILLCLNNTGYWRGMICRLSIGIDGKRMIKHNASEPIQMPQGALIGGVIVELKRRLVPTELLESRLDPKYDIQDSIEAG